MNQALVTLAWLLPLVFGSPFALYWLVGRGSKLLLWLEERGWLTYEEGRGVDGWY